VSEEEYIDAGLIFGAGFAPFRGGPMNYLNTLGKDNVLNKLDSLQQKHGDRFKPDVGFTELKKNQEVDSSYAKASGE